MSSIFSRSVKKMKRLLPIALVAGVCVAGLFLSFHPVLLSGFRNAIADPMDSRLVNLILEHEYRWLTGDPNHASFWSPPVFHPAKNTAAYSEILLGVAPFYWFWRAVGVVPDTAFQLWLIVLATLNYLAGLLVLRRGLRLSWVASSLGAAIFAFGSPRLQQLNHPQLLAGFYTLLALYAILRLASLGDTKKPAEARPSRQAWAYALLFVAALTAQIAASFYLGWFLVLILAIGGAVAVATPRGRLGLGRVAIQAKFALPISLAIGAILLAPLVRRYLSAAGDVGYRSFEDAVPMLLRIESWIYAGPNNWLYGRLTDLGIFRDLPYEHEHRLSVGVVTAAVAIAGLVMHRRRPLVLYAAVPLAVVILLATLLPGGVSAWRGVFEAIPGAAAIRAVCRVGMFALIPIGLGVALTAETLVRERRFGLTVGLFLVCLLEQGATLPSYDKLAVRHRVQTLTAAIPEDREAFLYTPGAAGDFWINCHVDAMWAGLERGKPTVNGYSGNWPRYWDFFQIVLRSDEDERRLQRALATWCDVHGIDPGSIAWIRGASSPNSYHEEHEARKEDR